MKPWIAYIGLGVTMVKADTRKEAVDKLLEECGYKHRPWVARDWNVRPATPAEVRDYAGRVANSKRSRTLASQVKNGQASAEDIEAKLL